jgi:hypothetical protein
MHADADAMLATIAEIALQIARSSPDCADAATRIAKLAGEVRGTKLEWGAVRDAVESGTADSDLSDAQVGATVDAVVKLGREVE